MMNTDALRALLLAYGVPVHLRGGLVRYLTERIPTGSFLRACLEGHWHAAELLADPLSAEHLINVRHFLADVAPTEAWGSPATVQAWIEEGHRRLREHASMP